MANLVKELQVYHGGHILNDAMVEYRNKQADQINSIIGIKCYNVLDDKSINDKENAVQEGLAERILKNDFRAMQESDIFVFDVLNEGIGTIAELSIVLGMKHQADRTLALIESQLHYDHPEYDNVHQIASESKKILEKPVLIYCSDIRQGNGKPYYDPDRAEFSTNQFVYGMILSLTNGKGFMSWEEVKKELEYLGGN